MVNERKNEENTRNCWLLISLSPISGRFLDYRVYLCIVFGAYGAERFFSDDEGKHRHNDKIVIVTDDPN